MKMKQGNLEMIGEIDKLIVKNSKSFELKRSGSKSKKKKRSSKKKRKIKLKDLLKKKEKNLIK